MAYSQSRARCPQIAGRFPVGHGDRCSDCHGFGCGTPSRYPNGENALELELMVKSGMKPEQALKVGTSEAAKLIGLSSDVGSLEAGKYADLIVVDGNPLDDIRVLRSSVKLVMKGGQVHRDDLGTSPSPLGSSDSSGR